MQTALCFDDVLIKPEYSEIKSRKDVDTTSIIAGRKLRVPIISANMKSVTGPTMANAIRHAGGWGCLHRFGSAAEMISDFFLTNDEAIVSMGVAETEFHRILDLHKRGAKVVCIDIAHGASILAADMLFKLKRETDLKVIVGNFATYYSFAEFMSRSGYAPDAIKVGVGGGSACTTRRVTGCGMPTFASLWDFCQTGHDVEVQIIADGGIRNSGDFAKAIAVGADAVMLGKVLVDTTESNAIMINDYVERKTWKRYSGSASAESYESQGKTSEHRTPEGESYLVPYTGRTVEDVMQEFSAGLRSAMSYVGASTIQDFQIESQFVQISQAALAESHPHGMGN